LERLIDFDMINSRTVRCRSAPQRRTGNWCISTTCGRKRPEHIMARRIAGLCPVVIDGEAYWDGGIVSIRRCNMCWMHAAGIAERLAVDLFSARGPMPADLFGVMQRHKTSRIPAVLATILTR
jgi:NTE family protein